MHGSEPSDLIQSVSRALRILEVVGTSTRPLTAKQISRRCGLALSTTYHLVRTLTYEGYLSRQPAGEYILGLVVADRFRDLVTALTAPPQVDAVLRHHVAVSGRSHYLARFVDGRVAITAVCEGPRSPHLEDLIVGFDEGAHATALGKALLDGLGADGRQRYLAEQGMRPYTSRTILDPAALEADLAEGAAGGLYSEEGQYREGVACVSVVVRDDGEPRGRWALGASVDTSEFRRQLSGIVRQLRAAAVDLRGGGALSASS